MKNSFTVEELKKKRDEISNSIVRLEVEKGRLNEQFDEAKINFEFIEQQYKNKLREFNVNSGAATVLGMLIKELEDAEQESNTETKPPEKSKN